jgi:hypothetical protein
MSNENENKIEEEKKKQKKNIITTKIYPTTKLSGNGFFYDNPEGSYIGDIKYLINNNNTITDIDKVNYVLKELFDYVKSAGKNEKIFRKEENIDNFFIADKTDNLFLPRLYNLKEEETNERAKKEEEKKTKERAKGEIKGGKKILYSKKNKKSKKFRKSKKSRNNS